MASELLSGQVRAPQHALSLPQLSFSLPYQPRTTQHLMPRWMEGFADLACRAAAFAGERVGERLGGAVVGKAGEHLAEAAAVRTAEKLLGRCAIGLQVLSEPELVLCTELTTLVFRVIAPLLNELCCMS